MNRLLIFLILLLCTNSVFSQGVGLALSGGAAKGLAHIGVIKALEENEIPIDYVVGTSMGAIVGSLYAMGYTPDEMIALFKSKDFKEWSSGEISEDYKFYFKQAVPEPAFLRLDFEHNSTFHLKPKLPVNLIASSPLSFGLLKLYSQANAIARSDFDNLMVPFRCVATDIANNAPKVFSGGNLGRSVRASMAFPFYYRPVTINDTLYFDGGIVNNFPIDVLQESFHPKYVLGSNVIKNLAPPKEDDLLTQIQNMIITRDHFKIPDSNSVVMENFFENEFLFDFDKIDFFVDSGYRNTLAQMEQIKAMIPQRIDSLTMQKKREAFKNKKPALAFKNIQYSGLDAEQMQYISRAFNRSDTLSIDEFESYFYKLLSDDHFNEIIPTATYNDSIEKYELEMDFKINNNTQLKFGGNFSTGTANQAFFGVEQRFLTNSAYTVFSNFHFGQVYNAIKLGAKIDIEKQTPISIQFDVITHKWNYYETKLKYFFEGYQTSYLSDTENRFSTTVSIPSGINGKFSVSTDIAAQNQKFINPKFTPSAPHYSTATESNFTLIAPALHYEMSTLNDKLYPTDGKHHSLLLKYIYGTENFREEENSNNSKLNYSYVQIKARWDNYIRFNSHVRLGLELEYSLSTMDTLQAQITTSLYTPAYQPTPLSRTQFLYPYRSPHYIAAGIKPIFALNDVIHLRMGLYGMLPIKTYNYKTGNTEIKTGFDQFNFIAQTGIVFKSQFGSLSLTADYFQKPAQTWFINLNFGYLIFNKRATD